MRTCLVVDDSRVIRKVSRHILESLDFTVEEAENGQLGLDKCAEAMPDVILLDWNMPVMSGMEFLGAFNDLDYGHEERPRAGRSIRRGSRCGGWPGDLDRRGYEPRYWPTAAAGESRC